MTLCNQLGAYNEPHPITTPPKAGLTKATALLFLLFLSNFFISYQAKAFEITGIGLGGTLFAALIEIEAGNVTFSDNSSSSHGGVIYMLTSSIEFTGSTVTFVRNTSVYSGGAIYIKGCSPSSSDAFIADSVKMIFTYNRLTAPMLSSGGAIWINGASMAFRGNSGYIMFSYNTSNASAASYGGGAICMKEGGITFKDDCLVSFLGNAAYHGGAIYGDRAVINFEDNAEISFINNGTTSDSYVSGGGAIYTYASSSITFSGSSNSVFTGNSTAGTLGDGGGAIQVHGQIFFQDNASLMFSDNKSIYGGGIRAKSKIIFQDNVDVTFVGNSVSNQGGAIYCDGIDFDGKIVRFGEDAEGNISGNKAEKGVHNRGGAIYTAGSITFSDGIVKFTENTAALAGGAIFLQNLTLKLLGIDSTGADVTFKGNKCEGRGTYGGGAIYIGSPYSPPSTGYAPDVFINFERGKIVFTENLVTVYSGYGGNAICAAFCAITISFKTEVTVSFDTSISIQSYSPRAAASRRPEVTKVESSINFYPGASVIFSGGGEASIYAYSTIHHTEDGFISPDRAIVAINGTLPPSNASCRVKSYSEKYSDYGINARSVFRHYSDVSSTNLLYEFNPDLFTEKEYSRENNSVYYSTACY